MALEETLRIGVRLVVPEIADWAAVLILDEDDSEREISRHSDPEIEAVLLDMWAMRYLEGRSPDEVMAALDITHRQYSRLFERATTAINRKLLAYLACDWCPGYASRFASLAADRATAGQAEQANKHLAACPSCRTAYETFTRLHPRG